MSHSRKSNNRRKYGKKKNRSSYNQRQKFSTSISSHNESQFKTNVNCNKNQNKHENITDYIVIDGSFMEGGGQILRQSMSLSAILKKPIKIINIRSNRSTPGLRPQHSLGIAIVQQINNGFLSGNFVKSMEVEYNPGIHSYQTEYSADTKTAGSVCLLAQISIPVLLFSPSTSYIILKGGTNASFAPQVDYSQLVFQPLLQRLMGIQMCIKCHKRGFYPRGGGEVSLQISPIADYIPSFTLLERGEIIRVFGIAIVSGPESMAEDMINGAMREIRVYFGRKIPIDIKNEIAQSSFCGGTGIVIVVESSTGCLFGGSALGPTKGMKGRKGNNFVYDCKIFEDVGRKAVQSIVKDMELVPNSCTDRWMQDQLIIFMALAKGKSSIRTCALELHTQTAIHFAQLMTGVTFEITQEKDGCVLVECEGIALENTLYDGGTNKIESNYTENKSDVDEVDRNNNSKLLDKKHVSLFDTS